MYIPLEEGEHVILKVHKHWWFIALRMMGLVFFLAIPFVVYALLVGFNIVVLTQVSTAAFVVLVTLWALVGWVVFWQFWTLYYMDMWVVTNRRLIDIDYIGFFDRNIAMLRLDKIQDLTVSVGDFFGNTLGYGTILVQTAGADKEFVIEQVSNPDNLRDVISKLSGQV